MLISCDEVNILNTFRVMIIIRQLLLLTNLHLKLLSTQGTSADKLLSTQRVKHPSIVIKIWYRQVQDLSNSYTLFVDKHCCSYMLTLVVRLPGVPGSPRRTRRRLLGIPGSKKKSIKKLFFFFSK